MGQEAREILFLLRHGEREDFVDPDWGRSAERPNDPALSPRGLAQAQAAATRLVSEGIDHIFTSPYLRCAQTAHVVAKRTGAPVHVEPGLGELNHPDWSRGLPALLSVEALSALTGSFTTVHEPIHDPVYPETIEQAFLRATMTASAILERYRGTLLFVGHAVSIIGIVRGLTGEGGDVPCAPASLTRIEPAGGSFHAVVCGDTSHLTE